MREMKAKEVRQRGCWYCADGCRLASDRHGYARIGCTHEECPYHILDNIADYVAWLRESGPTRKPGSRKKLMNL